MTKKAKIDIIIAVSAALFLYWAALAVTHTKYHMIDYLWQAGLSIAVILFGVMGMITAKHWSWLKSGVGQGVFFISLGLVMWGIGQAGWTYFVIKDPSQQTPPTHILDIIYSSSIPLWAYGMFKLSKATGARYGLRGPWPKVGVATLILVIFALSYYFLVVVARGGTAYFHQPFWEIFFDLGYAAGDAVNLTLALAIFGLSWKLLGGMFKRPVLLILFGFAVIYFADFLFSFYDGKGEYYNGHWVDLLYLAMAAIFAIGLCLLDPSSKRSAASAVVAPTVPAPAAPTAVAAVEPPLAPAVETAAAPSPPAPAEAAPLPPAQPETAPTPPLEPTPEPVAAQPEQPPVSEPLPENYTPEAPTEPPQPEQQEDKSNAA